MSLREQEIYSLVGLAPRSPPGSDAHIDAAVLHASDVVIDDGRVDRVVVAEGWRVMRVPVAHGAPGLWEPRVVERRADGESGRGGLGIRGARGQERQRQNQNGEEGRDFHIAVGGSGRYSTPAGSSIGRLSYRLRPVERGTAGAL